MFKRPPALAVYFNDLVCASETADGAGANTLTQTGNVPYGNQGQPVGGSASGVYSGANYMSNAASLNATMRTVRNSWFWECRLKVPNSGTQVVRSVEITGTHFTFLMSGDKFRIDNGAAGLSSVAVVGDSAWHKVRAEWNGALATLYVDNLVDGTTAINFEWPVGIAPERIGIYHDAVNFPCLGYLNDMRFGSLYGADNRNIGFSR